MLNIYTIDGRIHEEEVKQAFEEAHRISSSENWPSCYFTIVAEDRTFAQQENLVVARNAGNLVGLAQYEDLTIDEFVEDDDFFGLFDTRIGPMQTWLSKDDVKKLFEDSGIVEGIRKIRALEARPISEESYQIYSEMVDEIKKRSAWIVFDPSRKDLYAMQADKLGFKHTGLYSEPDNPYVVIRGSQSTSEPFKKFDANAYVAKKME